MSESQNIEWKESWRNDHMKHVCAFANTGGGVLTIGINDNGKEIGVTKSRKLLEDIPNRVVQTLGITVGVAMRIQNKKKLIDVAVSPSSAPVSCNGRFYIRSGSTTQELHGHELQAFILRKENLTWDALVVPDASFEDIDTDAIVRFARRAGAANRLAYRPETDTPKAILRKLGLVNDTDELTRAAILVFGKNPKKFIHSATLKIGRFGDSNAELITQDVIEGNLLHMAERTMEVLRGKYLHSPIHYEGIIRKEPLEIPEMALREAILNAIVHRDYSTNTDITIRIFDDRLAIWNFGALLAPLTIEMLKGEHPSQRRNALVADIFFRAGHIEAWGRGIAMMVRECNTAKTEPPIIEENAGGVRITFAREPQNYPQTTPKTTPKTTPMLVADLTSKEQKIIEQIENKPTISKQEIAQVMNMSKDGVKYHIRKMTQKGVLRWTGPMKDGHWEILKK